MSPPSMRRPRPHHEARPSKVNVTTADTKQYARRLRRRQGPSTFGLTPRELYLEAVTLYANGWSFYEIRSVLDLPSEVVR